MKTKFKRLPLETLVNARDIGGFATQDGKVTKYGRFIRSELPVNLSEKDMKFLSDYGVNLSIDFRTDFEVKSIPSCLEDCSWQKYVRSSVSDKNAEPPKSEETPPASDPLAFLNPEWIKVYITIAENGKDWVKRNMEIIADHDGTILYHCMTGKDRTGIFSAMLLGLCKAYPADIIADYSVSQVNLRTFYLNMMRFPEMLNEKGEPDLTKRFYQTRPETMYDFLEYIDSTYGSMEHYLIACDISDEVLAKIKVSFTEDVI